MLPAISQIGFVHGGVSPALRHHPLRCDGALHHHAHHHRHRHVECCERPCDTPRYDETLKRENLCRCEAPVLFDSYLARQNLEHPEAGGPEPVIDTRANRDHGVRDIELSPHPASQSADRLVPHLGDVSPIQRETIGVRLAVTYHLAIAIPSGSLIDVLG